MKIASIICAVACLFGLIKPVQAQTAVHDTASSAPTPLSAPMPTAAPSLTMAAEFCNPTCATGQLCGAGNQCLRVAPISHPSAPETTRDSPEPLPNVAVILLPEATLTFGNDLLVTAEAGATLQVRFRRLALGMHVASGYSIDGFNDYEGCLEHFCAEDRTRYGLNAEFAVSVLSEGQAWLGLDVERVTVNGWNDGGGGAGSMHQIVQRNGAFVTAKAGFELSKRWSHGLVGIGPFVGLTYGGVQDASGFGVIFGGRAACGLF